MVQKTDRSLSDKFEKLPPAEQQLLSARLLANPAFAKSLDDARTSKAKGDGVRWSDLKNTHGGS